MAVAAFVLIVSAKPAAAQQQGEPAVVFVFIDAQEQEIYTPRQAKMMQYRNEAGKKLKKVKAAPAGYAQTDDLSKMYVDEKEKEFYTPTQAKKMGLKNESGTALTQMSEIPEDFTPTDDMKKKN